MNTDETEESWTEKYVTPPQAAFLKARNVEVPDTRGEASDLIGKIKREAALNPPPELRERIEQLFNDGYLQTSRKFHHVARLPEGKSGIEALIEAEIESTIRSIGADHPAMQHWREHYPAWARGMGELSAAKQYRCCHAERAGFALTLDSITFEALRVYTTARGVDFSWGKL